MKLTREESVPCKVNLKIIGFYERAGRVNYSSPAGKILIFPGGYKLVNESTREDFNYPTRFSFI